MIFRRKTTRKTQGAAQLGFASSIFYAIVVYTGTGVPGSGAEADEWDIEKVFDYAWKERKPLIPSEDELAAAIQRLYAEAQQHQ